MKHAITSGAAVLTILFLLFVFLGDRFLPEPLGPASLKTRTSLNEAMMELIPDWRPKIQPVRSKHFSASGVKTDGKPAQADFVM